MPTVANVDLFAHGDFSVPGGGPYNETNGNRSRVTDFVRRGDPASLRVNATASVSNVGYNTQALAAPRFWYGFFWYCEVTDPGASYSVSHAYSNPSNDYARTYYHPGLGPGAFQHTINDITFEAITLAPDNDWHWIEGIYDMSTTTHASYLRVDGVDLTPVTLTGQAAETSNAFYIGGFGTYDQRVSRLMWGSASSTSDWHGEPVTTIFFPSNAPADVDLTANVDKALRIETPEGLETEKVSNTAAGPQFIVAEDTPGGTDIWFVTPPLNAFSIPSGSIFDTLVYMWESNAAANVRAHVQCYRLNRAGVVQGSQFVDWALSSVVGDPELVTTADTFQLETGAGISAVDFEQGDRLLFLIIGSDFGLSAMAAGHTFTTAYGTRVGAGGTYFTLPAAISVESGTRYQRIFGPGQLAASATTLYTAPDNARVEVRSLDLNNPSGSTRKVTLSIGSDAAGTRVEELFDVPAGESFNKRRGFNHTLEEGEFLQGYADSAGVVVATINGWVEQG